MDDQPLLESCCELVPSEALNPRVAGIMPPGPLSLVVAAALMPPASSASLPATAWPRTEAREPMKRNAAEKESSRPRRACEINKRTLHARATTRLSDKNTLPVVE